MRKTWLAVGWMVAVALAPGESHAQSPQDLLRAQKLYEEADKLEQASDLSGALAKFEEAMGVVETAQLRLRAGRCQEKLGRLSASLQSYKRAKELAGDDAALSKLADDQIAVMAARVPLVRLKLPADAPTTVQIKLDGAAVQAAEHRVDPGAHVVTANAEGFLPFERKLELAEKANVEVVIALEPVGPKEVKPPADEAGTSPVPWVLIGVGGGFLAASIGLGVASAQALDSANNELAEAAGCTPGSPPVCPWASAEAAPDTPEVDELNSAVSQNQIFLGLSISSAVVAAGLVATGTALALTGATQEPPVVAWPWLGVGAAGLSAAGRF